MADITDPFACEFTRGRVRSAADRLAKLYIEGKAFLAEWYGGASAFFPNDSSVILDGASTNGLKVAKGTTVNNIATRLVEFVADMEANDKAKLNTVMELSTQIIVSD